MASPNAPPTDYRNILTTSFANVDLNSASATRTPTFVFPESVEELSPISLLRCSDCAQACIRIKDYLLESFNNDGYAAPGILRVERLDLHLVPPGQEGWLLLAEHAAFAKSTHFKAEREAPQVTILAVLIPHDSKVRWFYTLLPIANLLKHLDAAHLIHLQRTWKPGSRKHKRFHTYIREAFHSAISIPHAPDYINAQNLTDYCPSILEPDTALQRLEQNEFLYFSVRNNAVNNLDLGDDRYLLHLHPAEREVASLANLKCAEYMFIKRNFFHVFYEEIYRSNKKIDPGASAFGATTTSAIINSCDEPTTSSAAHSRQSSVVSTSPATTPARRRKSEAEPRQTPTPAPDSARRHGGSRVTARNRVRSEHAHKEWLEREYEFRSSRAKMLVTAWRELGFLDEGRFLGWVRAGGLLENEGLGGGARGEIEMENDEVVET